MNKIHFNNFFKYLVIILFFYNIFSLFVLFTNNGTIKRIMWRFSPYDYNEIMFFPNNYKKLSLKESRNITIMTQLLELNISKNTMDPNFWNYKLILDNYSKRTDKNFEITFLNLLVLSKNNPSKVTDLKKYFFKNYKLFSENNKTKILKNFENN